MSDKEFLEFNKKGWNNLSKSNKPFSNTSLPEYGPFMANEDKLQLFKNIKGKSVLELGCAAGNSLKYLALKGAKEVVGIDISEEQIKKAKSLNIPNAKFWLSPMEENPGIPINHFDYVLSLYSLGFSANPIKTLKLASSYLKSGGTFIMCWIHPFFNCLGIENNKLIITHNYNDESKKVITKGTDQIELLQYNLKISTIVNSLITNGFEISQLIEEEPLSKNGIGDYHSTYWDPKKLESSPTTLIIVACKK